MQYVATETAVELGNKVLKEGFEKFKKHMNDPAWKSLAKRCGHFGLPTIPSVIWKKKGFGLAGTAFPTLNLIEMNINYLHSPDALKFIRCTMLHELAHILNGYYGGRNHDYQWREICYIIGDDGGRCHDYKRPENEPIKNKKQIRCKSCGKIYDVTAYRYNKVYQYRCKCHGELEQV